MNGFDPPNSRVWNFATVSEIANAQSMATAPSPSTAASSAAPSTPRISPSRVEPFSFRHLPWSTRYCRSAKATSSGNQTMASRRSVSTPAVAATARQLSVSAFCDSSGCMPRHDSRA